MPADTDPVVMRQMMPSDLPYVFSTWLRDARDADGGSLSDDEWFTAHRALIERVLANKNTVALVAAASDQPNEILGYVVAEPNEVLWWVTVRKALRGNGLAKRLLTEASVPPGTPAAFTTSAARNRLQNPPRGRQIRSRHKRTEPTLTASPSANSAR